MLMQILSIGIARQRNFDTGAMRPNLLPAEADSFIRACRETHGLPVKGLMCIPPVEEAASIHFALLREIARGHLEAPTDAVAHHGATDLLARGDSDPERGLRVGTHQVADAEERRVDAGRSGKGREVSNGSNHLETCGARVRRPAQTVRRLRPRARRRAKTLRPAVVDMRFRKPCSRNRCRFLGWCVRFMSIAPVRVALA